MVQLQDYSNLRQAAEPVVVPLNGVRYHFLPEAPADVILSAGSVEVDGLNLPDGMTMEQVEKLAETDANLGQQIESRAAQNLRRVVKFLIDTMEPDSWETWSTYMKAPPKGLTPGKRKQHVERMIVFPQLHAVFKAVLVHYTGHPTGPSSTSQNGDGGTGGTSMDGAPAEA